VIETFSLMLNFSHLFGLSFVVVGGLPAGFQQSPGFCCPDTPLLL